MRIPCLGGIAALFLGMCGLSALLQPAQLPMLATATPYAYALPTETYSLDPIFITATYIVGRATDEAAHATPADLTSTAEARQSARETTEASYTPAELTAMAEAIYMTATYIVGQATETASYNMTATAEANGIIFPPYTPTPKP